MVKVLPRQPGESWLARSGESHLGSAAFSEIVRSTASSHACGNPARIHGIGDGRDGPRLHRNEFALDLPAPVSRKHHRPRREPSVAGPPGSGLGRSGGTSDRGLRLAEEPDRRADRAAGRARALRPAPDRRGSVLLGHRRPPGSLGSSNTPIPAAWGTWMAKVIPDDLEAGGGLHNRPQTARHRWRRLCGRRAVRHRRLVGAVSCSPPSCSPARPCSPRGPVPVPAPSQPLL